MLIAVKGKRIGKRLDNGEEGEMRRRKEMNEDREKLKR